MMGFGFGDAIVSEVVFCGIVVFMVSVAIGFGIGWLVFG